ncbi:MAG: dihydrofolate reductase [Desulfuromusa sp.]|nr:dihydrofolate reductase [Desulfuromusa sp.]
MAEVIIIVAMTPDRLIGKNNQIPWRLSEDLKSFKQITTGHTIVMGRKTFASIGKPLPNRNNLVVSRTSRKIEGCEVFADLESALQRGRELGEKTFIIGGGQIYQAALPLADSLYISWVDGDFTGDTFFPDFFLDDWQISKEEEFATFKLVRYQRKG